MKIPSLIASTLISLAGAGVAGEMVQTPSKHSFEPTPLCFAEREWQVDLFGVYAFTESDQERAIGDHAWGGGLGVNYFFQRNIGIGIEGTILDPRRGRDAIGTAALNVFVRFPNDAACIAPYLYGGVGGIFNAERLNSSDIPGRSGQSDETNLLGHLGAGIEYRFTPNLGIFVDGRYTFVENAQNDFMAVRTGFRCTF